MYYKSGQPRVSRFTLSFWDRRLYSLAGNVFPTCPFVLGGWGRWQQGRVLTMHYETALSAPLMSVCLVNGNIIWGVFLLFVFCLLIPFFFNYKNKITNVKSQLYFLYPLPCVLKTFLYFICVKYTVILLTITYTVIPSSPLSLLRCVHVFKINKVWLCVHVAFCALEVKILSRLIYPKSFTIKLREATPSSRQLFHVGLYVWCFYIKAPLDLW